MLYKNVHVNTHLQKRTWALRAQPSTWVNVLLGSPANQPGHYAGSRRCKGLSFTCCRVGGSAAVYCISNTAIKPAGLHNYKCHVIVRGLRL